MSSLRSILQIHPADDAIVALRTLTAGTKVSQDSQTWSLVESIPAKQKFAARDFAIGDVITMYGVKVGRATQAIPAGGLLHTANVVHDSANFTGKQSDYTWSAPNVTRWRGQTFQGFAREGGGSGTANHWIVIDGKNLERLAHGFPLENR